jgi:hypothetical protein
MIFVRQADVQDHSHLADPQADHPAAEDVMIAAVPALAEQAATARVHRVKKADGKAATADLRAENTREIAMQANLPAAKKTL